MHVTFYRILVCNDISWERFDVQSCMQTWAKSLVSAEMLLESAACAYAMPSAGCQD